MRPRRLAAAALLVAGLLALALTLPATLRASALTFGRAGHSATLLPSGQVLVAGGSTATAAELYDPASDSWALTGATRFRRIDHAAVALADGRVLVVGGSFATRRAEIYDPATGRWSETAEMSAPRLRPAAARLADGRVLVVGGSFEDAGTEIYDPATDSWASAAPGLAGPREGGAVAVTLPDGRVLVAGGSLNSSFGVSFPAELYAPASDSWALVPLDLQLTSERLTPLADGRVLLTGTALGGAAAAIFDPATSRFGPAAPPPAALYRHSAVALADGRVLLHGMLQPEGFYPITALRTLIYDPAANRWATARPPAELRFLPTLTLLPDGHVLITGGQGANGLGLASAERYDPTGAALERSAYLPQVGAPFPTAYPPFPTSYPPFPTAWPVTPTPFPGGAAITYIALADPAFPDSDEFVEIGNFANGPVNLTGWQLRNSSRPEIPAFVFPSFTAEADMVVALYTREGTNDLEIGDFYWGQAQPLWQVGDVAELLNAQGQLVHSYVVRAP
jgi:hypothetical protein